MRLNRIEGLLFSAWVILSGLWVAAVLVVMDEPHPHTPWAGVPMSWIIAIAAGPPALLLGFGLVGVWLTRRRDDEGGSR
jgi:hypothetical protein